MYRQTEFVLVKTVLWVFLLIYGPWFFLIKYELDSRYRVLLFFWTLAILIYAVGKYLLWLVNVYVLTDKRLISFEYKSLFNKSVLETPLDRILNVSFTSKGVMASLMNFGDVFVQVQGLPEPMVLKKVKDAGKVKDFLWKAHSGQFGK